MNEAFLGIPQPLQETVGMTHIKTDYCQLKV